MIIINKWEGNIRVKVEEANEANGWEWEGAPVEEKKITALHHPRWRVDDHSPWSWGVHAPTSGGFSILWLGSLLGPLPPPPNLIAKWALSILVHLLAHHACLGPLLLLAVGVPSSSLHFLRFIFFYCIIDHSNAIRIRWNFLNV